MLLHICAGVYLISGQSAEAQCQARCSFAFHLCRVKPVLCMSFMEITVFVDECRLSF